MWNKFYGTKWEDGNQMGSMKLQAPQGGNLKMDQDLALETM